MNKKVIPFPTLPLPELPVGTRVMSEWTLHVGKQRFGFELSCQALNPAPKLFVVPAPPKSSGSGPKKRRKR